MKNYLLWIKPLFFEMIISFMSFFFGFFSWKKQNWEKKEGKPILLVHGYLHSASVWFYQGTRLHDCGFGPIYTINLKKTFSSIFEHIKSLERKIQQIKQETNCEDVILIGHSMGGLISSYYAVDNKKDVSDVITIASPLSGTKAAIFGIGKSSKEMRINSSFIRELKDKILSEKDIRFYHIASKKDQLVRPYDSALLGDNLDRQYVVDGISHASLLYSKKVNDKIIQWLS